MATINEKNQSKKNQADENAQNAIDRANKKREDIKPILKGNLSSFLEKRNLKQLDLCTVWNKPKGTVSNYLNLGMDNLPDIVDLALLKEVYGVSIDAWLSTTFNPDNVQIIEGTHVSEYDKYIGVYNLYYITTNKITSTPSHDVYSGLSYGVLAIIKDDQGGTASGKEAYKVYARFSMKDLESANTLKSEAEKALNEKDTNKVCHMFIYKDRYSEGIFELIQQGRYYSMNLTGFSLSNNSDGNSKQTSDKISIVGYNPSQTNAIPCSYIGGGMICSSISRGRKKTPCAQMMIASRKSLTDMEEVEEMLLQKHTNPRIDNVSDEIYNRALKIFESDSYTAEDKEILLKSYIKTRISNDIIQSAESQIFYLTDDEDAAIYEYLKSASTNN